MFVRNDLHVKKQGMMKQVHWKQLISCCLCPLKENNQNIASSVNGALFVSDIDPFVSN